MNEEGGAVPALAQQEEGRGRGRGRGRRRRRGGGGGGGGDGQGEGGAVEGAHPPPHPCPRLLLLVSGDFQISLEGTGLYRFDYFKGSPYLLSQKFN